LEMAEIVEDAFRNKHHAILEAGTGTGKTLAYLLPAIRSGRRVVVSTATKSLQEQLFNKDIPFLQKHFAPEIKVAVMKGRGNFLCRQKVHRSEEHTSELQSPDHLVCRLLLEKKKKQNKKREKTSIYNTTASS